MLLDFHFKKNRSIAAIITFNELGSEAGRSTAKKAEVIHYFVEAMKAYGCTRETMSAVSRFVSDDAQNVMWQGDGFILGNLRNALFQSLKDYYHNVLVEAQHKVRDDLSSFLTTRKGIDLIDFIPESNVDGRASISNGDAIWKGCLLGTGRTRAALTASAVTDANLVKCIEASIKASQYRELSWDLRGRQSAEDRRSANIQHFLAGELPSPHLPAL